MLLPSQKPSSYSLLKFVYITSQLRNPLVVEPLLRKILDRPCAIDVIITAIAKREKIKKYDCIRHVEQRRANAEQTYRASMCLVE